MIIISQQITSMNSGQQKFSCANEPSFFITKLYRVACKTPFEATSLYVNQVSFRLNFDEPRYPMS